MPKGRILMLALLLACEAAPLVAQQSAPANPLNDLLAMQMNWDASKSDDNAKPSVTLRFVPYAKHQQDGKSFTSYYVYAEGLPQNQPYALIHWQIGWDAQQPPFQADYTNLYVNARGVVLCQKPNEKEVSSDAPDIDVDRRLDVIAAGALGEPARYALLANGTEIVAMGRLIVNPIQAEDKGCHFQAIRAVGGAEIVLVEGTGFSARTDVELSSATSGKPQTAKFRTDGNGRLETAVVLMRKDQMQGTATITMKSDACAPSVKFDWGHDTYQIQ
jgi:hypothetical protein